VESKDNISERNICKHIFSYETGIDEAWLNCKPKHPENFETSLGDVIFKYCPLCGEELILEYE